MINFFRELFSTVSNEELKELIKQGAVLIDVRGRDEFEQGHAKNSKNIPLGELATAISNLDMEQTYILVCASGVRSRIAVVQLKRHGFTNVYNGGSWSSFQ